MTIRTTHFLRTLAQAGSALIAVTTCAAALAQGFPSRPVRMVVPASPSTAPDFMSRTVAQDLGPRLGQSVVVENVPGAGGNIASVQVARAAPDGHTLLMQLSSFVVNPSLYRNAGYDPIKQFDAIIQSAWTVTLLAISTVGTENVNTVKDFVAYVKARPGKLNYTSSGVGTPQHLRMAILNHITGMDLTHIPFKTPADMTRAMVVGDVLAMFNSGTVLIPQARSKKVKLLAYIGNERWPETPDVPTMSEAGFPEFKADIWHGFFAPAGTPRDIIRRINTEMAGILTSPGPREALIKHGVSPYTSTPEQFAETVRNDYAYWTKIVKTMGLEIQ